MRYWWVNQNQTYRHEVHGGYLWSPKRSANGARNPFYESMREVAPGDLVFSFADTKLPALGVAQSYCWESPKPLEFGAAGPNWENVGWKVKVNFTELKNQIRPKDHIDVLRPLLPSKYSPLQPNGNGLQSVYLTELPTPLAEVLIGIIGEEATFSTLAAQAVKPIPVDDIEFWEQKLETQVATDPQVPETDRLAIIRARRGQGLFRERVSKLETRCRVATWYKSEGALTTYLSGYVLSAVIEDLNKAEKSTLAKPITAVLARERAFEVGELNSGHFVLNPTNQAYSLVMYFPPESDGTLGVRLIGNVSSPNQVVLGFPEGGTKNIGTNGEQLINLTKFFSLPAPEGTLLSLDDGVFVRPKQFKDLRVITFQFLGPDVDKPPPNGPAPTIDVTYVALISPPIKLEQRQGQH